MKKLLLILAIFFTTPLPAFGHGSVVHSYPAEGAVIAQMPTEVSVEVDGHMQILGDKVINYIVVKDSEGNQIDLRNSEVHGGHLLVGIDKLNVIGVITASYRFVSEDGHAVKGAFTFTVKGDKEPNEKPERSLFAHEEDENDDEHLIGEKSTFVIAGLLAAVITLGYLLWRKRKE